MQFDPNRPVTLDERGKTVAEYVAYLEKTGESEHNIDLRANLLRDELGLPLRLDPFDKKLNLTQRVRNWIELNPGIFTRADICHDLDVSKDKRASVSQILTRLMGEGLVERTGNKVGTFTRLETEADPIDFLNVQISSADIELPFAIQGLVEINPGDVIILAGAPNTGKTSFALNTIALNMGRWDIHYFNSEMGAEELQKRPLKFDDIPLADWRFKAWQRYDNFADVIAPGLGKLNIIDFLEIYGDFYQIGARIAEIHKKLRGAVALIQKNPGLDHGLGGYRSLEKPRLALAMDHGALKIVKAKNWRGERNPNGRVIKFKIVQGANFIAQDDWSLDKE